MKKYIFGIDVGGTSIKIGKFDLSGTLIEKWDIPTNKTDSGSHIIEEIYVSITSKTEPYEVYGYGFGVPGAVTNNIVTKCVNLGWEETNIENEFKKFDKTDAIIKVNNDANVAGLGETFFGAAKGFKNVCLITLGTGVGGAIIIDSKITEGFVGGAGEIGHIVVEKHWGIECNCGKKGCLETVASATGIVNLAKRMLEKTNEPSMLRKYESFSAKRVIDFAKEGDKLCLKVINTVCDYLGYVSSIICHTINPEMIIFGGGVSNAGIFLLEKIERACHKYVSSFIDFTKFALAKLGNDAGIYGACSLLL